MHMLPSSQGGSRAAVVVSWADLEGVGDGCGQWEGEPGVVVAEGLGVLVCLEHLEHIVLLQVRPPH